MKKIATFIIAIIVTLLANCTTSYAVSYYTNNKALDDIFTKLEKEFLKYEKDEKMPRSYYELTLTEEQRDKLTSWPSKKMTDKQLKAAVERELNSIRVAIEIKEEYLGGLTSKDYKVIEGQLVKMLYLANTYSNFCWEMDGKTVSLSLSVDDDDLLNFVDFEGKFATMGKAKDQVDPEALKVKDEITRYLNQSKLKGNEVSQEVLKKLPGEIEKLFIESNVSKIVASRALSDIHEYIYTPEDMYLDGTESIEDLVQYFGGFVSNYEEEREKQKKVDYYEYTQDEPSTAYIQNITKMILNGDVSETFTYGFNKAITTEELAKLYFENKELDEIFEIEENVLPANSSDDIKKAFIYGMINDASDLNQPLTRLEAARKLVNGAVYQGTGVGGALMVTDYLDIPIKDHTAVATCIFGGMKTRVDKFEPKAPYTKEEAMNDSSFHFRNLRGYNISYNLWQPKKIILGKNTINILFESTSEIKSYIKDNFSDTVLGKIKLTGKYMKIDTGCALIEFFTPEKGIKFTIKDGVEYIDFDEGRYGPNLEYTIEAKVVTSDTVNMKQQPDSNFKKMYAKLDVIIAKIIKPNMTQVEKVKVIHDYVVTHITYDSKYGNQQTVENAIISLDSGRGVCGDYAILFAQLCRRAGIPCNYEAGFALTFNHAWNVVYVNNKWLFVDCTWDDPDNKGEIRYTYFLKDKETFMKTHEPHMGVPDEDVYTDIDNMNIKSQEELRGYLLQNMYWVNGFQLQFRMANKKMKPAIQYMRDDYVTVKLTYDSKKDIYTVTAKAR